MNEIYFQIRKSKKYFLSATLHKASPKKLIILSHGFTGSKSEGGRLFVQTSRYFAERKLSSLRFDFMGSGESSGNFKDASPNTEIEDLKRVIQWACKQGYTHIGLLGLSLGGAVTIYTTAHLKPGLIKTIVTWSSVPSFSWWCNKPRDPSPALTSMEPGTDWFKHYPQKEDVPESYCSLKIPKLQIQGDRDLHLFREKFQEFFPKAPEPKKHLIIPGADHVFCNPEHRKWAIQKTFEWFSKYL